MTKLWLVLSPLDFFSDFYWKLEKYFTQLISIKLYSKTHFCDNDQFKTHILRIWRLNWANTYTVQFTIYQHLVWQNKMCLLLLAIISNLRQDCYSINELQCPGAINKYRATISAPYCSFPTDIIFRPRRILSMHKK